ncbi:MAG: glycoside hydrolase family 13 protein [Rhodothermales bacterium]
MTASAAGGLLTLALALLVGCAGSDEMSAVPVEVAAVEAAPETPAMDESMMEKPVMESGSEAALRSNPNVPAWAADAVFYQLFPERFRNGDVTNDPTRASLETPLDRIPANWAVTPWTSDWYARADWETVRGDDFYEDGVFDRRYGGDLQGVIDKLDYLKDLGINTIYFNPVFYARSLHKYDGNSFHHVDPHFGPDPAGDFALMATETSDPATWHHTEADKLFYRLLDEAHARGLRVIIDGVFNHTGRDFFAFENLRTEQAASPYTDWYVVESFDDPATPEDEFAYAGWWGVETLPEFADTADGTDLHPGPKEYVFDATARWHDPNGDGDPSDGIDGWRLDVANEVPVKFWTDWNAHVRELNPEAYTVTEIWEEADEFVRVGGFSATMNYHGFAFPVKGFLIDGTAPASAFAEMLNERREEYPEAVQYALQNLVDSHDTDRVASMIVNADPDEAYAAPDRWDYDWTGRVSPRGGYDYDVRRPSPDQREIQRLVALMQMTYVGPPMIYYGTEAGMWGADDPDDRKPMVWADLAYDDECADPLGRKRACDEVAFDADLFAFHKEAIALRNESDALRHGDFRVLLADDERAVFAFARTRPDEAVVVVLNRSDEAHSVRVPVPVAGTYALTFATTKGPGRVQQDAEALLLDIPARTGLVLTREDR